MSNYILRSLLHSGPDFALRKDPTMRINEIQQAQKLPAAKYRVLQETQQGDRYVVSIEASLAAVVAVGTGFTKKEAKRNAANALLHKMGFEFPEDEFPEALQIEAPQIESVKRETVQAEARQQSVLEEIRPSENISKNKSSSVQIGPDFGLGKDPSSRLSELQMIRREEYAVYRTVEEKAVNDHAVFTTEASLHEFTASGTGLTKKEAKRRASAGLLRMMGFNVPESDLPITQTRDDVSPSPGQESVEERVSEVTEAPQTNSGLEVPHSEEENIHQINQECEILTVNDLCDSLPSQVEETEEERVSEVTEAPQTNSGLEVPQDLSYQDNQNCEIPPVDDLSDSPSPVEETDEKIINENTVSADHSGNESQQSLTQTLAPEETVEVIQDSTEALQTNTTEGLSSERVCNVAELGWIDDLFDSLPTLSNKGILEEKTKLSDDKSSDCDQISMARCVVPESSETEGPNSEEDVEVDVEMEVDVFEEVYLVQRSNETPGTNSSEVEFDCAKFGWIDDLFSKLPSPVKLDEDIAEDNTGSVKGHKEETDRKSSADLHVVPESTEALGTCSEESLNDRTAEKYVINALVEKLLKKQSSHVKVHHDRLVGLLERSSVDHFTLPKGDIKTKNLQKLGKAAARDLVYQYGDIKKVLLVALNMTSSNFQKDTMKHLNLRLDAFQNRPKSPISRFFNRWDKPC